MFVCFVCEFCQNMMRLLLIVFCSLFSAAKAQETVIHRTISANTFQSIIGQFQLNFEQRNIKNQIAFTAQLFGGNYNKLLTNGYVKEIDSLFSVSHIGFTLGVRVYENQEGLGLFTQISAGYKDLTMDYSRSVLVSGLGYIPAYMTHRRYEERKSGFLIEVMGGYRLELKRVVFEPNWGCVFRRMRSERNLSSTLPPSRFWFIRQTNFFMPFVGMNLGYRL